MQVLTSLERRFYEKGSTMSNIGRPKGHGKYAKEPQVARSFRLTRPCDAWIDENGGRPYLESLVPEEFRQHYINLIKLKQRGLIESTEGSRTVIDDVIDEV